jgi:outer membrane lipoprotein-sorting protein
MRLIALQKLILFTGLLLVVVSSGPTCLAQETKKLTAEEVITSHLESIGTAEARSSFKSLVAQGAVEVTIRIGGGGKGKGGAVMASQGPMSLMGFIFGQEASNEKMAFNGQKLTLGELRPGLRTPFGDFVRTHDVLFREGLLGGTLSTAWPFLYANERKGKLRSLGTKNLKDRKAYVLGYEPRNGGNLDIKLYFDTETFQHLRSEYQQEFVAPTVLNPDKAARQKGTRFKLTEEFSDFRSESSVVLPHTYKIQFSIETESHPLLQDWVVTLSQFVLNKTLDAKQFDLTAP